MTLKKSQIEKARDAGFWEPMNNMLYDICKKYPEHKDPKIAAAKLMIIGRSYAAALERGVSEDKTDFWQKKVAPRIIGSKLNLDTELAALKEIDQNSRTKKALEIHSALTDCFNQITDQDKRSLASKYLHFHAPDIFYIYDSRAQKACRAIMADLGEKVSHNGEEESDATYSRFFLSCERINEKCQEITGNNQPLTPREIDNLFLRSK